MTSQPSSQNGRVWIDLYCSNIFVSSWANSILQLPTCFSNLLKMTKNLISNQSKCLIEDAIHSALSPIKNLQELLTGSTKIQHSLSRQHYDADIHNLIKESITGRDSAWLRSLQEKGAGAWLRFYSIFKKFCVQFL